MIKLTPVKNEFPYYHIIFNYMIGDGNGHTEYDLTCVSSEIEEVVKYVSILNKLNPLEGHWGVCFNNYPEEYPGEYIGVSKDEYTIFIDLLNPDNEGIKGEISMCLKGEIEYALLIFEGVEIYYYNENNVKYSVEFE